MRLIYNCDKMTHKMTHYETYNCDINAQILTSYDQILTLNDQKYGFFTHFYDILIIGTVSATYINVTNNQNKTNKENKNMKIETLLKKIEGTRWTKQYGDKSYDRLYISSDWIIKAFGFETTYDSCGRLDTVTLNGEKESKHYFERIRKHIISKCYIDLTTMTLAITTGLPEVDEMIKTRLTTEEEEEVTEDKTETTETTETITEDDDTEDYLSDEEMSNFRTILQGMRKRDMIDKDTKLKILSTIKDNKVSKNIKNFLQFDLCDALRSNSFEGKCKDFYALYTTTYEIF